MTKKIENRNQKLMEEIIRYLYKRNLHEDVFLFANGKEYMCDCSYLHYMTDKGEINPIEHETYKKKYYEICDRNPKDIDEYCNPDTVSMTFEGPFYHAYNGYALHNYSAYEDIEKIGKKYGLYPSQGYAWSLSFWEPVVW